MKTLSFAKIIDGLAYRWDRRQIFSDFLEMVICAFSLGAKEARYMEIISTYSPEEVNSFADALGALVIEMDDQGNGYKDVLGEYFTLEITNGHNGQYFTPQSVCDMMQALVAENVSGKRILDPTCGSGRTLIAAAKRNPDNEFFGADVDRNCAMMTAINMCLNSMTGEVAWMDSLKNTYHGGWRIQRHFTGVPYLVEIPEAESRIVLRLTEAKEKPPAGQLLMNF